MNWLHRFKPMLAADCGDYLHNLRFPLLGSFKIDGIRACTLEPRSRPLSRSLKYIPNNYVCDMIQQYDILGCLDMELVALGDHGEILPFNETSSAIMSVAGQPRFLAMVHDKITPDVCAKVRLDALRNEASERLPRLFHVLEHRIIENLADIHAFAEDAVAKGYEGIMLRDWHGFYKFGQSTEREQRLLKLKRWKDSEAVVEGFEELMHNENTPTINALGYQERSQAKAGLVPAGTLGKLLVRDKFTNVQFAIGSGFTAQQRYYIWTHRDLHLGKLCKYKSQDFGEVDKPRTPSFLGWRFKEDMSNE